MTEHYHHGNLPRRLRTATRAVVEEEGPAAVTIARIARECGVSVAAPYRHFAGKEALLGAVAADGFDALREALTAADGATPTERLVAAGVAYVDFATTHPHLFELMFRAERRERQSAAGPPALEALATLVNDVPLRVPTDVAVRTTWGLAHGLAMLRIGGMLTFTREDTAERLRAELTALVEGIAPDR